MESDLESRYSGTTDPVNKKNHCFQQYFSTAHPAGNSGEIERLHIEEKVLGLCLVFHLLVISLCLAWAWSGKVLGVADTELTRDWLMKTERSVNMMSK